MVFKHYSAMKFYILTVQIIQLLSGNYSCQCINVFHNHFYLFHMGLNVQTPSLCE